MTTANPLLSPAGLPDFGAIRPEHVGPAVTHLLGEADAALERAVSPEVPATYDALSAVLDVAVERLGRAWGAVSHLNAVANTPALREAYNESLPAVTAFLTRLGADARLFAKYRAVADSGTVQHPAQRQALNHALRDFVLSGAELVSPQRERFAQIQERAATVSQQFAEHVLDATDAFTLDVPADRLAGVPADVLSATRRAAEAAGVAGHRLTLHAPVYLPVMRHARDRDLRETLYTAYVTRASEAGPAERDNSALMREILDLRQEEAALLGYANFAELSLVPKMANQPAEVLGFLRDLAARARPYAEQDMRELAAFASDTLGLNDLQAWDLAFASERLKEQRYAYSENEVRAYFPLPRVLAGLYRIIETLFGVRITVDHAAAWHPSVQFFRIERPSPLADGAPETLAHFYLDLHARPGKRPGAWMDDARSRWRRPEAAAGVQTPVAHLVCNFPSPQGEQPALLTHDDVITLFHEFGHGLHHMLTRVEELAVSGIQGVEWDAVELPSQFMENFCWEWEVVRAMTAHVETGEPLPRALFDKMLAARNFHSGPDTLRQIEFALLDLRLHAEPGSQADIQAVVDAVRAEIAVVRPPAFNRFQHTFSHIFAGGYAAGYYSYKWAEVLSADAYAAFEEAGVFDPATGERFRREILEVGGSRPAAESFRAFRGREPRIDALLRHQGMAG